LLCSAARRVAALSIKATKNKSVQLPTSADNVTLLAFAAERRAAERRAAAGRPAADAVDRHLLLAGPTAANPPQRRAAAE